MANVFYDEGLKEIGQGDIVWKASGGSTIKAILVDTASYTFSQTHTDLDDVPAAARVTNFSGTAQTLTLIDAAAGGVLDANDISFTGLSGAPSFEAIILYKDTGVESTSTLIMYIDTAASGLPTPASATQVDVTWNNGANKIAKI